MGLRLGPLVGAGVVEVVVVVVVVVRGRGVVVVVVVVGGGGGGRVTNSTPLVANTSFGLNNRIHQGTIGQGCA